MPIKVKRQSYTIYQEDELESLLAMRGGLKDVMDYFPERHGKTLPDEGGWIQVIYPPPVSAYVPYLGIFYAVPKSAGEINLTKYKTYLDDSTKQTERHPYLVKILTHYGEVCLFPYEFNPVSDIYKFLGENELKAGDVQINWMSPRNEMFDTDLLHYIQSRGIRRKDAYQILLGDIKNQNVCYLTFAKWIQEHFAGAGIPSLQAREMILNHIDKTPMSIAEYENELKQIDAANKAAAEKEKERKALAKQQRAREKMFSKYFAGISFKR